MKCCTRSTDNQLLWCEVSRVCTATFSRPYGRPDFTENSSACLLDVSISVHSNSKGFCNHVRGCIPYPVFPGVYIPLWQCCLDRFCPRSRLQSWPRPICKILLLFSTTGQLTCLIVSTLCWPESANVIACFDIWLTTSPFPTLTFCNFIMNHIFKHALIL